MTKLELTIIQAARNEMTLLHSPDAADRDAAISAFHAIMAFVMLAHMQDSGLSEDATKQLLDIEKEAAQALAMPEFAEGKQARLDGIAMSDCPYSIDKVSKASGRMLTSMEYRLGHENKFNAWMNGFNAD